MIQSLISRMNHQQHHLHQQQPPPLLMDESLSNLSCASGEATASNSSVNPSAGDAAAATAYPPPHQQPPPAKKKRSLPGNPDPDAEVIALSPKSLLATNRFVCEICNKGFQRDQNLQLHRRGHNLPWKLKQRSNKEVVRKKVYVCPEPSCVHHDPSRALGDLTGIKKHYCRKHGEKKWKCDKCSKRYAVQSDWKAHSKICGTKEYRCDCGTLFSRRDSFITHRAFCDVLAEETARAITTNPLLPVAQQQQEAAQDHQPPAGTSVSHHHNIFSLQNPQLIGSGDLHPPFSIKQEQPQQSQHENQQTQSFPFIPPWLQPPPPSSSSSSTMLFNQEIIQTPHGHTSLDQHLHQNPGHVLGGPTGFPTAGSSSYPSPPPPPPQPSHPHMSATALLQKAAQMGAIISSKTADPSSVPAHPPPPAHVSAIPNVPKTAGSGLNLSSRDQQQEISSNLGFFNQGGGVGGLSSFGNKAATTTESMPGGCAGGGPRTTVGGSGGCSSSSTSSLLHDIMMNSLPSFDGDNAFGNGGNDNLTRDFLGLRPLPHSDMILTMAGLADTNAASSSSSQDHNKTWQG